VYVYLQICIYTAPALLCTFVASEANAIEHAQKEGHYLGSHCDDRLGLRVNPIYSISIRYNVSMYMQICTYMCVCVCDRLGLKGRDTTSDLTATTGYIIYLSICKYVYIYMCVCVSVCLCVCVCVCGRLRETEGTLPRIAL